MRLFIAATFPAEVLCLLSERIGRIKSKLPPASWVRPETQHLTFAFLGEQDAALIDKLAPLVEHHLAPIRRFEARLCGCGFFPNPRHARVGWVGVTPEDQFREIAAAVRAAVAGAGVEPDGSDFKPHLTLMRVRDRWPPACIETFQNALHHFESEPFEMEKVTLYLSQLKPQGAIHTPLRDFTLAA